MIAFCEICDWNISWDGNARTRGKIRNEAKKHVLLTGHNVTVETGSSSTYSKQ